jgi:odorant receptor
MVCFLFTHISNILIVSIILSAEVIYKPRLNEINELNRKLATLYLISACFAGMFIVIIPLAKNISTWVNYFDGYNRDLPFKVWSFYDATKHPAYEITYVAHSLAVYVFVLVNVGIETLFFTCCLNICTHFDILRESFDGDKKKFVENHLKIHEIAVELNQVYKPMIFIGYSICSMLLCVLGFQFVVHESFSKKFEDFFLATTVATALFVYAFGGQLIMDKSSLVAVDFYELDRDFVFIIQRVQQPLIIQSVYFELTLPSFTAIMNSAGSLITLLQSFLE